MLEGLDTRPLPQLLILGCDEFTLRAYKEWEGVYNLHPPPFPPTWTWCTKFFFQNGSNLVIKILIMPRIWNLDKEVPLANEVDC